MSHEDSLHDMPQPTVAARWALDADGVPRLIQAPSMERLEGRPITAPPRVVSPKPRSFWHSCMRLIGHLSATATVFVAFFCLAWLVSLAVAYLGSLHRIAPAMVQALARPPVWAVYTDAALSGVVLLCGVVRFARGA